MPAPFLSGTRQPVSSTFSTSTLRPTITQTALPWAPRIRQDVEEGTKLGVRGTPAFFLNKVDAQGKTLTTRPISGALPFEQFDQAIKAMLDQ